MFIQIQSQLSYEDPELENRIVKNPFMQRELQQQGRFGYLEQ